MENENLQKIEYFQTFFLEAIERKMPKGTSINRQKILTTTQDLVEKNAFLIQDKPSLEHLHLTCTVIASFRELKKKFSLSTCLSIVRYAFVDNLSFITPQVRALLDQSKEPFREIVSISKEKEKEYGKTFEFYRKQDDDRAYLLEIKKCFYCNVLKTNNSHELMPIFCDFDTHWMKAIHPEKHGFRFDRPETIGTGGNTCKFYFTRVDDP